MLRFRLLCMLLVVAVVAACSDGVHPEEGFWDGDHFRFEVKGSKISGIASHHMSCNGDGGCFAQMEAMFVHDEWKVSGNDFSGTLENMQGVLTVSGTFRTDTRAEGTYGFESTSGCCSLAGTWRAEFLAPFPADSADEDIYWPDDVLESGDDVVPDPDVADPGGLWPPSASQQQVAAIVHTNKLRQKLSIPVLTEIEPINLAAQAHAEYFDLHCSGYMNNSISPHYENSNWIDGFTGETHADRMTHFGFQGYPGWEVMAFVGDPVVAIESWVETLYHRIPFVHPNSYETGYGITYGGCYNWAKGTDVMDFSIIQNVPVTEPVAYPYDGQTGVYRQWLGNESPQPPMPAGQNYPSGPIITLTFPGSYLSSKPFSISIHDLIDPTGNGVAHEWVTPANDPAGMLSRTVSLYSYDPLLPNTKYTVRLEGKWSGEDRVWEWSFTTGN
jgi:hypothetical protein